jgi:Ca2+-transporting ATPase
VLLLGIGVAQWTVLRPLLPKAAPWIGWTAMAWFAGLMVFMAVATPLWHPGQQLWLVTMIGALAGALMALTMAAVTGWGLVRLLPAPAAASAGRRSKVRRSRPAAWR